MTIQEQQNTEPAGGLNNTSSSWMMMMMSCPYSRRPATTDPHHHPPPPVEEYYDTTGLSRRKRYDTVVILAMASAIFLYHSFTIHGLATSQAAFATAATVDKEELGQGPPALEIFNNSRKRRVLSSSAVPSSTSSLASSDDEQSYHDDDIFRLAREQSFGFFDDIPNHIWQRAQQIHAKTFPNFYQRNKHLFFSVDMTKKSQQARNFRTSDFNLLQVQHHEEGDDVSVSTSSLQTINRNYADASFQDETARKESSLWYGENFHVEFHCPLAQRIPSSSTKSKADGPKWVCDPHRIAAQETCLIYSVGSNGNVLFEQGIRQEIGSHCESK
jgi:Methyltransferase domain